MTEARIQAAVATPEAQDARFDMRGYANRIQGPEFLVEFENAQPGGGQPGEANHIHTVWRDPANDFGDDLLLRHYAQEHLPYAVTRLQSTAPPA